MQRSDNPIEKRTFVLMEATMVDCSVPGAPKTVIEHCARCCVTIVSLSCLGTPASKLTESYASAFLKPKPQILHEGCLGDSR